MPVRGTQVRGTVDERNGGERRAYTTCVALSFATSNSIAQFPHSSLFKPRLLNPARTFDRPADAENFWVPSDLVAEDADIANDRVEVPQ